MVKVLMCFMFMKLLISYVISFLNKMIIKHIQLYPYQVKKRKKICRYVFFCITYIMLFYLHFLAL